MQPKSSFVGARSYAPAEVVEYRGARLPAHFGDGKAEYQAGRGGVAVFDRSDRGRVVVQGTDRKRWLHGLVTNAVATLDDDSGNYAFAIDARGRTLFDLNILAVRDALWLDIERGVIKAAMEHLDRYLFAEHASMADASGEDARIGVCGLNAPRIAAALGVTNFVALPALAHRVLPADGVRLVRHDFAGTTGFELIVPVSQAPAWWDRMVALGARASGFRALDALRIEAGVPWLGRDIDDRVLPPETGQIERGISYVKGCYVGYEILERMRSRGALARRLVKIELSDRGDAGAQSPIWQGESEVGRLTSLVRHPARDACIGLGYLKTTLASFEGLEAGEPRRAIRIVE